MPSLEEMLAAIAADDAGEDTESEETVPTPRKDNSAFKQLRDHAKKLEREAAAAKKEAEELREWKQTREEQDKSSALAGAGLSPRQAEVFLKFYGDVTPENVAEFRKDVLGVGATPTGDQAPSEEFRPTGSAGFDAPGDKPLTMEEVKKLKEEDPDKALALLRSGNVQFRTG